VSSRGVPAESFWQRAVSSPDKTAIVDPDATEWTYGQIGEAGNQVARGLLGLGLGPGDAVASVVPNSHILFEILSGVLQSGLFYVPVNWHLTADEIEYILRDSAARAVFASARFGPQVAQAVASLQLGADAAFWVDEEIPGFSSYQAFKANQSAAAPPNRSPGQRMYYTSGTTGRPKGVRKAIPEGQLDEDAVAYSARLFATGGLDADASGVHLVTGPAYHAAPLGFGMSALHLGQTVVLMDRWSSEAALGLIDRYRVTNTHMVPTMFHRLLQIPAPERQKFDLSSLRGVVHASAPCPVGVKRQMIDWLGPIVNEYYASTEGGGTSVTAAEWLTRPGTVGRPAEPGDIKIFDDSGRELGASEIGTVYSRLKVPFEYHGEQEKTMASRRGDYFTVGDIGYLDPDGYLYLTDRSSDIIISGGVNIYPSEVEAVLLTHPAVQDAAVIGIPSQEWGEEVKAVVELRAQAEPSGQLAGELITYCRQRLASYKCPRSVDFTEKLPRYDSGKLYKRRLRDVYWEGRTRRI
jgi:long-chain acyl-CoA synthetase